MPSREFRICLYNTFSQRAFGGNTSWIVPEGDGLDVAEMQSIATELAAAATAFLVDADSNFPRIRFFSPTSEFDMCGHAIVGAMCALADLNILSPDESGLAAITLRAPPGVVPIEVTWNAARQPRCAMMQPKPWFKPTSVTRSEVASLLGIPTEAIDASLPIQTGSTGLKHIFVPLLKREFLVALEPDMDGLKALSEDLGVQSVAVFTQDTSDPSSQVRGRDLCPAIGVPEEAASGTTNGAIACYLVTQGRIPTDEQGRVVVTADQGLEMGRPSRVQTELRVRGDEIVLVKVTGTATCLVSGSLKLA